MSAAARSVNGAIAVLVFLLGEPPPQNWNCGMRIGSSPQTECHPFLVAFPDVMREGDVELGLDLRVLQPAPLCKAEERFVARVMTQGIGERVARREIDAETALYVIEPAIEAEPVELLQLGRIRGEPRGGAWSLGVGIASRIDEGSRHAAEFTARMPRFDTLVFPGGVSFRRKGT
jgi:hypothetical protein